MFLSASCAVQFGSKHDDDGSFSPTAPNTDGHATPPTRRWLRSGRATVTRERDNVHNKQQQQPQPPQQQETTVPGSEVVFGPHIFHDILQRPSLLDVHAITDLLLALPIIPHRVLARSPQRGGLPEESITRRTASTFFTTTYWPPYLPYTVPVAPSRCSTSIFVELPVQVPSTACVRRT